ncbi:MAG: autotransporter domain-containing protein [Cellvibrionaceae bacterium]
MKQLQKAIPLLFLSAASPSVLAFATANPDSASMVQGSGTISIDVLANDTNNLEGSPDIFIQSFDSSSASYGSVVLTESNSLAYTPPSDDFVGTDTFTYAARDQSGYGGSATVTITVTANSETTEEIEEVVSNGEFAFFAKGARNTSVGETLDNLCAEAPVIDQPGGLAKFTPSEVSDICIQLSESETDINKTINEIAPDEALIQRRLLIENFRTTASNLHREISKLREGDKIQSVTINGKQIPFSGGAAGDTMNSEWNLLSSFQYENFEHALTENEAGYDYDSAGIMLGLGYQLNSSMNIGAAIDWKKFDAEYHEDGGELTSDIISINGFFSWYQGPLSLDLIAGYSTGDTDAQRQFTFPTQSFADSSYDSSQINLSALSEWAWQINAFRVSTFLRLDYFNSTVDAYTETGNSAWITSSEEQGSELLNSSIGLDVNYATSFSWGVMTPGIRLSFVNESNLNEEPIAFQLVNSTSTLNNFELSADETDDLFYRWDINSVFVFRNGFSAFLSGEIVSGHEMFENYTISAGFNVEF